MEDHDFKPEAENFDFDAWRLDYNSARAQDILNLTYEILDERSRVELATVTDNIKRNIFIQATKGHFNYTTSIENPVTYKEIVKIFEGLGFEIFDLVTQRKKNSTLSTFGIAIDNIEFRWDIDPIDNAA
jgi:hypothetical protein